MKTPKELHVWKKSVDLVTEIYLLTSTFPHAEKFGLVSQMRKCVVSIPSNIAEGYARKSQKDNARFVGIAFGSATELETQLILSNNLGFIDSATFEDILSRLTVILKMLYNYRQFLLK